MVDNNKIYETPSDDFTLTRRQVGQGLGAGFLFRVGGSSPPPPQTIVDIQPHGGSGVQAANGTVLNASAILSPLTPTFSGGTFSVGGTNSGGFHFSGTNLQQTGGSGTTPGTYNDFSVTYTNSAYLASPFTLTAGTVSVVITAPGSLALAVNGFTSSDPTQTWPSGDQAWVSIRGAGGITNTNSFVELRDSTAPSGYHEFTQRYSWNFAAGQDDIVVQWTSGSPLFTLVPPGSYFFVIVDYSGGPGNVVANVPITISSQILNPLGMQLVSGPGNAGLGNFQLSVISGTILGNSNFCTVVTGTIGVDVNWATGGGHSRPQGAILQYTITGVFSGSMATHNVGGVVTQSGSGPSSQTFDTTTVADGTYVLNVDIIDFHDVFHGDAGGSWTPYLVGVNPINLIVMNGSTFPTITPPVLLPAYYYYQTDRVQPNKVLDQITYHGIPEDAASAAYPGPGQSVVYVPPAYQPGPNPWQTGQTPGPPGLRSGGGAPQYREQLNCNAGGEYQDVQLFMQSKVGGIFVGSWFAKNFGGHELEADYTLLAQTNFRDGGRNSNQVSPFSNFIPTPIGTPFNTSWVVGSNETDAHYTIVQLDGRVCVAGLDGKVTTIAGNVYDKTAGPQYDWADTTKDEFTGDIQIGTIANPPFDFGDFGGTNDVCWDPRNPNILYVAKTIDHFVMKVDFTVNGGFGPSNPQCSRYAGYDSGILGDGIGGYVDGAAIGQAQFNGIYSICMQKVSGISGHPVGTMYVADNYNCLIRKIDANPSTIATSSSTSCAGTTMTVAGTITGTFLPGSTISGGSFASGTVIVSNGTGSGGAGTYTVSPSQTVVATAVTATQLLVSTLAGAHSGGTFPCPPTDANTAKQNSSQIATLVYGNTSAGTTSPMNGTGIQIYGGGSMGTTVAITLNGDGIHGDIVVTGGTTIVASVGWKIQIVDNGVTFPPGPTSDITTECGMYYVTSFTDSQHFSVKMNPVPNPAHTIQLYVSNLDTYSHPVAVNYGTGQPAYTIYPQTVKINSTGDLIIGEAYYNQMIRRLWLNPSAPGYPGAKITRIGAFEATPQWANNQVWGWNDVDFKGACGPVDDIITVKAGGIGSAEASWLLSIDGSYSATYYGDNGPQVFSEQRGGGGHYPWARCYSLTQARVLGVGESDTGLFSMRAYRSGVDPVYSVTDITGQFSSMQSPGTATNEFVVGYLIFNGGTTTYFPFGMRPTLKALYGAWGFHLLGQNVLPEMDDLPGIYPHDATTGGSFVDWTSGSPDGLAQFIQSGMGGIVPRPELSVDPSPPSGTLFPSGALPGRDLANILYLVHRQSIGGSYPTQAAFPPFSLNFIRPVISAITTTRLSTTSIRVQWTTDKATLGVVLAGSPFMQPTASPAPWSRSPYSIFAPESSYGTSHNVTISGLWDVTVTGNNPTHVAILVKDQAGNWQTSADIPVGP